MLLEAHIIINMHDICQRLCFTTKLPPQDEKRKTHVGKDNLTWPTRLFKKSQRSITSYREDQKAT